jgi:hypothetical protein
VASSTSPNLNAKYNDWVQKMRNWTIVNTPQSKVDIATTQRTKGSGLFQFKRQSKNAHKGQSRKFSKSLNAKSDSFKSTFKGNSKGNFISKLRMCSGISDATLQIDSSAASCTTQKEDEEILFFNDDVQEIYGSDCDLYG